MRLREGRPVWHPTWASSSHCWKARAVAGGCLCCFSQCKRGFVHLSAKILSGTCHAQTSSFLLESQRWQKGDFFVVNQIIVRISIGWQFEWRANRKGMTVWRREDRGPDGTEVRGSLKAVSLGVGSEVVLRVNPVKGPEKNNKLAQSQALYLPCPQGLLESSVVAD